MQAMFVSPSILANILGGWEAILILTIVLILRCSRILPIASDGLFKFQRSLRDLPTELDQNAHDALRFEKSFSAAL